MPNFHTIFFMPRAWNPPLFIRSGGWVLIMHEEEEVYGGKGEGEIDDDGSCRQLGDGLVEEVELWLFMAVLRWWQLKTR